MSEHQDLRGYFRVIKETSEGWKACCPRCDDKEWKFYWNVEKRVGCCMHSSCLWFTQRGGATERRVRAFFQNSDVQFEIPEVVASSEEADVKLPKEFRTLDRLPHDLRGELIMYLDEARGLSRRVVEKAKVGYCERGKFWGYIIFPVFNDDGEVIWWQGRRYKNRDPKFWNPKSSMKTEILYGISSPRQPKRLVLVESIINCLTLETGYDATTNCIRSLLGKTMSETQMDIILSKERWLKEIVIALDPDARREAVDIATRLQGRFPCVKLLTVPEDEDINTLGRERSWELIDRAPLYDPKKRMEFLVGTE